MLLQRLAAFEPTQSDGPQRPYSRARTIRWQLDIRGDGTFVNLIDLANPTDKATKNGVARVTPHLARSSGVCPCLGADDVQYVLGWADNTTRPGRVSECHQAFIALCQSWASAEPGDETAAAVMRFYTGGAIGDVPQPEGKWSAKDIVLLAVDEVPITASDSLWRHWQRVVEDRKSGAAGATGARQGICLVCGTAGSLLNRMPQALPKTLVPRADQEVALVSANRRIHTYDFSEGLGTAPICVLCGQRAVQNLHTILSDPDHTFTYRKQSTRLAWWATSPDAEDTVRSLDASPQEIKRFLDRTASGVLPRRNLRTGRFCAVTISANISRLVVHEWIDLPLAGILDNVREWFADHAIIDGRSGDEVHFPLWRMVAALGRWIPSADSRGVYATLDDKSADRPTDAARNLLRAALLGRRRGVLPPILLAHLVRRIRTDQRLDQPRAALLRLLLTRAPSVRLEAPMAGLDESNLNPAYLAGRVFSVVESIQRAAYPGDDRPNVTFFNRYFSGAVTNPAIALVQGTQLSAAWLKKLEGRPSREGAQKDRKSRAAHALRGRLTNLYDRFDATGGLPRGMGIDDQTAFILGYFHQNAHDQQARAAGRARAGDAEAELTEPELDLTDTEQP